MRGEIFVQCGRYRPAPVLRRFLGHTPCRKNSPVSERHCNAISVCLPIIAKMVASLPLPVCNIRQYSVVSIADVAGVSFAGKGKYAALRQDAASTPAACVRRPAAGCRRPCRCHLQLSCPPPVCSAVVTAYPSPCLFFAGKRMTAWFSLPGIYMRVSPLSSRRISAIISLLAYYS